jgi:acetyl esterase/lipase
MALACDNIGIRTSKYGEVESQVGDLYLPIRPTPPIVCLLHGGFWRLP